MDRSFHRNPRPAPLLCAVAPLLLLGPAALAQAVPSPATDAAAPGPPRRRQPRGRRGLAPSPALRPPQKDDRHDYTQEVIETRQGDVALSVAANGAPLNPDLRQTQIDASTTSMPTPISRSIASNASRRTTPRQQAHAPPARCFRYHYTAPSLRRRCSAICRSSRRTDPSSTRHTGPLSPVLPPHLQAQSLMESPRLESKIMRGMAGEVWIETSQERLTRLNAHLIADVDFGWGIIGRLDKGGTIFLEQTEMEGNDWELTRMKLNLTGKALIVKTLSYHLTQEMARYSPVPATSTTTKPSACSNPNRNPRANSARHTSSRFTSAKCARRRLKLPSSIMGTPLPLGW